jgi:hypothetical protein
MSQESAAPPGEFRRYRRLVSALVLGFVSLGCAYLLVSVGVTIYRRRNAVPNGSTVAAAASLSDLQSCHEELTDVEQGLERHLENYHRLLAHYDAAEAQRWSEDQSFWLGEWKAAGKRCVFGSPRSGPLSKEWEELAVIHAELRETEAAYTKDLLHFGQTEAPRLDRVRERLIHVGNSLEHRGASDVSNRAQSKGPHDSGDIPP